MNHYDATLAQSQVMAQVNMIRETDKFIRRLYKSRNPLGTTNDELEQHMIAIGLVYRENGHLLRLTSKGVRHAREIG